MFRKTWKQLKILLVLVVIIICLPRSIFPSRNARENSTDLSYYISLNNSEKRLSEFRDSEEALKMKLEQLDVINRSRKRYNAQPVKLDILASRVANMMSREAAVNEYVGHWNMAGEKPYHRYAFAGGADHVSENAFGEWSSAEYNITPSFIVSMMKAGHDSFMKEKAPRDGHKKNIIDKSHNFVGIGYYASGKQFRYYEEFIDRYFEFGKIPSLVRVNEKTDITFKTDGKSFPYLLVVYYEKFPRPMSPGDIRKKGSYNDFTDEEFRNIYAWELARYKQGTEYTVPLSFTKEGLYYIQIFTDKKEFTKPASLSTKGKTPLSGIVIKVTG